MTVLERCLSAEEAAKVDLVPLSRAQVGVLMLACRHMAEQSANGSLEATRMYNYLQNIMRQRFADDLK